MSGHICNFEIQFLKWKIIWDLKKKFLDVFQISEVMFYSEKDCILQNFALSKSQKFRGQGSKFPQEGMGWSHSKLSKWISKPPVRRFELSRNLYAISFHKRLCFGPSGPALFHY